MFQHFSILIIALVAVYTDLSYGKIYNWMTYPAIVLGLLSNGYMYGLDGFKAALLGIGVAFVLTCPFLMAGGIGGGDVKLLMAIGSLQGALFLLSTLFYAAIIGGIWAMGYLIWKGKFFSTFLNVLKFSASIFYPPWRSSLAINKSSGRILFGIPIALGCFWTLLEITLQDSLLIWLIAGKVTL
jgi:prepilin peptidase CpaA